MKTSKPTAPSPSDLALRALESDLGEPTLYRATGRFLAAQGLDGAPLNLWGLVALTATRVIFRHYPQAHPLFGGKSEEVRWESARSRFDACELRKQGFWAKVFAGTPDHIGLTGAGVLLIVETADDLRKFPEAWHRSAP